MMTQTEFVPGGTLQRSTAARQEMFEHLMLPQREALNRVAYWLTRDRDDAEDMVQETLVRAYAKLDTFRPAGTTATCSTSLTPEGREARAARAWLYAILRNLFFNDYRSRSRGPRLISLEGLEDWVSVVAVEGGHGNPTPEADERNNPAWQAEKQAEHAAILRSLSVLPEKWRLPIVMVDIQGCSYQEVSTVLCLPINTVRSRIHRGRRILQRRLTPWQTPTHRRTSNENGTIGRRGSVRACPGE